MNELDSLQSLLLRLMETGRSRTRIGSASVEYNEILVRLKARYPLELAAWPESEPRMKVAELYETVEQLSAVVDMLDMEQGIAVVRVR